MKYKYTLIVLILVSASSLFAQIPKYYSHSWSGINYGWDMAINYSSNKIYVRNGFDANGSRGNNVKIFDSSGNLLGSFTCVAGGDGIAVDYYGNIYVGEYDVASKKASIKVYSSNGTLIRYWDLPLGYVPPNYYTQSIIIKIDFSSDPRIYILVDGDQNRGTFFIYDRYGDLLNSWEPTAMITSAINMSIEPSNNFIFILSYNWGRVYQYNESGELLNSWGEFDQPLGIANSVYGIIAVSNTKNNSVQLFYSSGNLIDEITNYGSPLSNFDYPNSVVMSATGDWMYVLDDNGIHAFTSNPTSVSNENSIIISYSLSQNYPNPFNPETTIKYEIPKSAHVTLKIYDITGKLVATLVNERKSAGKYSVMWNASNVSSGVYIYRITAGNFSGVKKGIVLK